MNTNPLEAFQTKEVTPVSMNQLEAGVYKVKVAKVQITTDALVAQGETTADIQEQKDWLDENPVIYVLLASEQGIHHHRLYYYAYKKWNDLVKDPAYAKTIHKYRCTTVRNAREYAIERETNHRIIDTKMSQFTQDLINMFATACHKVGERITEWEGAELWIEIKREFKFGKWRYKVVQFSDTEIARTSAPAVDALPKGLDMLKGVTI